MVSMLKFPFVFIALLLLPSIVSATLTAYPASCTAGQECNVYYKFETALANYKCVIDVFGGTENVRVYSKPDSSKMSDEKAKDIAATKSINSVMFAKLPRMAEGQYTLNIECGDGKTTETVLSSVKVESPRMQIYGTQYEVGSPMKLFTQIANGVSYDNGTCFLTMYYPKTNVKLVNNVVMTTLGENGMYYYNSTSAPNELGIYMTSVKCTFPDNVAETLTLQYNSNGNDTYVDSSAGNTNYGSATDIRVQKSAPRQIAFIKPNFNTLLGSNHTIDGSTLYLFRMGGAGTTPIDVFPITGSWSEGLVTWNTMPTISKFSCTGGTPTSVQAVDGWYSWDMTRCVQNFSNGQNTSPYYGFAINATTTTGNQRFYSGDYVGWELSPKLVVTHSAIQNITFYSQAITEIQVVPATFNGSIDLTELGDLVNQTNFENHQICLESGVCIDDPKFLDYRRGIGMVGIGVGGNAFSDTNLLVGILFMTLLIFITLIWVYKKRTHKKVVVGYAG
jgi:hypothetical protein